MKTTAPLQILIFRHPDDKETLQYEEHIVRALQGGKEAGGYLASGEDLGIQLQVFTSTPTTDADEMLNRFCHTLILVLADHEMLVNSDDSLWDWMKECWGRVSASNGRHGMLVVPMDERVGQGFAQKSAELGDIQLLQVHELGERGIRAAILALRVLHECRLLLAGAISPIAGRDSSHLRFFISHAKIDGLPLAHALKRQIEALGWLKSFYDVDDLPAGRDWKRELEKGVGSSLIIMLRTEVYDSRPWCQQEVLWADEFATPAVLVDARTGLNHPANTLPFDRVPTVRIPDGNLFRILFLALKEGLRFLHFMRRVAEMKDRGEIPAHSELRVFSFQPGMSALLRACRLFSAVPSTSKLPRLILYPDPPLRAGSYEAACSLVETYAPGARLLTPNTVAALGGITP